ncbi:MAG: diguanylate cyclase, partial [Candidatus Fermentibacteraceae bacterium]|nr:diguanylate cyclase [Candidatus Fermentibacteraceae bacterium]
ELLQELFWRSSLRVAVIDRSGRLFLTSKAFRDAFSSVIGVADGYEILEFDYGSGSRVYLERLAGLLPGEAFSSSMKLPFAGVESEIRVETSALFSKREQESLFLTEWIPSADSGTSALALEEIEQKYRNLQENLPVGIYRADQGGLLQTANSALIRMMGFDSFEELQQARLKEVWVDPGQRVKMIRRLRSEGSVLGYQVNLRRKNGEELIASFDARGTFDAEGRLVYFDTIVQDITSREMAKRELEKLARTDSLTGLLNRQHLMERLEEEMDRTFRYRRPLSLMIVDLDHFKDVNDNHGHLVGDAVLKAAATRISETLRKTDFAGRYGGEEFCVVLPETGLKGATGLAERLRKSMEGSRHPMDDGTELRITCSIGVAEASCRDIEETIAVADAALYLAKRSGRNRVERAACGD